MKTLANCKPSEFLQQTCRIRKTVANWLDVTGIMDIRKRMPEGLPEIVFSMTTEEKREILKKRNEMLERQGLENFYAMLDAMMEDHPKETLDVLALCCFVEPEQVDDHPVNYYLTAIMEMVNDEAVRGFFTLLMRLDQKNTSIASEV